MIRGGKAIASGSYGCVFSPGLACEGGQREPGTVSKLMYRESADEEYTESMFVRVAMETMDSYLRDLFIVPLQPPCKPSRLTPSDLIDVAHTCPDFTNINLDLSVLRILTQKDGGRMFESFKLTTLGDVMFKRIVSGLVQLLFALNELNLRGVLHGDVKAANVVVEEKTGTVRLIDWGFTRTLDAEYTGRFWKGFGHSVIMFNCMPSMWAYNLYVNNRKRPSNTTITDFIHFALQSSADSNQFHLNLLDKLFTACNNARAAYSMPVITYNAMRDEDGNPLEPILFDDGSMLSQMTTQILVAHGAAVYMAILFPGGTREDQWARFYTLVDTVLRVNVDLYGILMCFEPVVDEAPTPRRDLILASLSSYLMSAAYAVKPFDVDELANVLRGLFRPGAVPPVPKDDEENFMIPVNVDALEAAMDPEYKRAFVSDSYIVAMRAKERTELTVEEQVDEIRGTRVARADETPRADETASEVKGVEIVDLDDAPGFSFTELLQSIAKTPKAQTPKAQTPVVMPPPPPRPPKRQRRGTVGGRRLSGGVLAALYKHE